MHGFRWKNQEDRATEPRGTTPLHMPPSSKKWYHNN